MDQILFTVFAALAVASALLAITRKNVVASACWLVVMFFQLAAVFVLLEAFFVAAVQILVYAGAIMVLFLFVIMLLDLRSVELTSLANPRFKAGGIVLAGAFLAATVYVLRDAAASPLVADRVAVTLRPAAPPPGAPGEAAAPVAVEMAEVGVPAVPGAGPAVDRAWTGDLPASPGGPAAPRRLAVTVSPSGEASLALDGKPVAAPSWDQPAGAPLRRARVSVPGAPEGAALEVVVRHGGLDPSPAGGPDGSPRAIGRALFERWLLPFEVASVLLTGAIFGAVVLTKRRLS